MKGIFDSTFAADKFMSHSNKSDNAVENRSTLKTIALERN